MIISASRRSDIPAFYGEWFMNRLRAGEVLVRNPMQPKQVSRIVLSPETVDAFVFWTKNPAAFLPYLQEIDAMGYPYYFLFTVTPYGTDIEPGIPDKRQIVETFRRISGMIGPERTVWRYDPIILTPELTPQWHMRAFGRLSEELSGSTERCIVSFFDEYRKVKNRMRHIHCVLPDKTVMGAMAEQFARTAQERNITLCTCSEDIDLSCSGIAHSRCIDSELLQRISGVTLRHGVKKDKSQRRNCGCVESRDIGSYDTCTHGCLYCYAVSDHLDAFRSKSDGDSSSPMLCDRVRKSDTVTTPRQSSRAAQHQQLPFSFDLPNPDL
ncbi:MAG: DUF1848 domain-containing protein [Chlorobiaceae bacterium]|nr:DUF1848 domain-containing protein [Chlorobiaceae bacterium]NTV60362.1 DUF1848 domain-containing protein [Chlorobiaceae bacterium]